MKKILAGLLVLAAVLPAVAKDQTLIDDTDVWKMYSRPELSLTEIGGETVSLGSLSVGWTLNDQLSLGPAATVSMRSINDRDQGKIDSFDLWYAGLRAEYTLKASSIVHASASLFIGGGDVEISESDYLDGKSGMVVFEPGVNVAVNAWDWVEIGLSVSYRFTDDVGVGGYDRDDLQAFNVGVFARFSEF